MGVTLETPDPTDHGGFAQFADAYLSANDRSIDVPWLPRELQVLLAGDEYVRTDVVQAREGDEIVAVGWAELPERDNTDVAFLEIAVPARHRRRGHGTAVLQWLCRRAAQDGRSKALTETTRFADDETGPGREFVIASGFAFDTVNAQRQLDLPTQQPPVEMRDGYGLAAWRGDIPPQWIDEYAVLRSLLNQEAPSGETELENEFWDADRLRLEIDQWWRQHRVAQTVVAVAPDGSLAGHTQLVFPRDSPDVYQWDTLVLAQHRGHGLGLALKRQAMVEAADLLADRTRIVTWNDATNDPMIAVNEELGYRLTAWSDQWARPLNR